MKVPDRSTNGSAVRLGRESSGMKSSGQMLALLLSFALIFTVLPQTLNAYQQDTQQQATDQQQGQDQGQDQSQGQQPPYTQQTPEQLQQLVAPIALYPDSLVAQILAATTFPAEVVEADRWLQAHPDLKGDDLAKAVDQQPWDPSVKALTAFPTVLGNMDKNISWTSSLGDAYYNQQQDVMDAIQVMRQKAQSAGNLKSTDQQTVQTQGSTIVIQPANPQIVYVPAYDPWIVYGGPIVAWPGWYPYPGIWWGGPGFYWGAGFGIGWYGGYGWGWNNWGVGWHNHVVVYNHNTYYSHSRTFYNRNVYYRHGGDRGVTSNPRNSFNNNRGDEGNRGNEANRGGRDNGRSPSNVYNRPGATTKPFEGNETKCEAGAAGAIKGKIRAPVRSAAMTVAGKREAMRREGRRAWCGGGGCGGGRGG